MRRKPEPVTLDELRTELTIIMSWQARMDAKLNELLRRLDGEEEEDDAE